MMASTNKSIQLAWLAVFAYLGLIFALSSLQGGGTNVLDWVPFRDKGVHFVEYGILGALFMNATETTWASHGVFKKFLFVLASGFVWALADEAHQAFVPGRATEWKDVVADSLGLLTGATLCHLFRSRST